MQLFLRQIYVFASALIFLCVFWAGGNPQTRGPFLHPETSKSFFSKKNKEDAPLTSIPHFPAFLPITGSGGTTCRERFWCNARDSEMRSRESCSCLTVCTFAHSILQLSRSEKEKKRDVYLTFSRRAANEEMGYGIRTTFIYYSTIVRYVCYSKFLRKNYRIWFLSFCVFLCSV